MCKTCGSKFGSNYHLFYWLFYWLKRKDWDKFFRTSYHIINRKAYYKWRAKQNMDILKRRYAELPDSGLRYECFEEQVGIK